MIYRRDIDGLRAIAVVPVVLYHAHVAGFSGGFTGVDIFFVISGYLITGLIAEEIGRDDFSIIRFYQRRARRILPALLAVMVVSTVLAAIYFLPRELEDFGRSIIGATFFTSNLVFWKDAGYFDAPAELKPLLHTWSLAVEEQFYLGFPVLLLLCHRCLKARWTLCLVPLLIASFIYSVWASTHEPDEAFYLMRGRGWELLLGAVLALGVVPALPSKAVREIAGLAGLALIVYGIVHLSPELPFPGFNALFPCLGAALILWSGIDGDTGVARALAIKPLVLVGLMSYSLYLWHWPALVFSRYVNLGELSGMQTAVLLAGVAALSCASYRYIEMPIRRGASYWHGWRLARAGVVAAIAGLAAGGVMVAGDGLPGRIAPEALALLAEPTSDRMRPKPSRKSCSFIDVRHEMGAICRKGALSPEPSFVLVGDSHAGAMNSAVFEAAESLGLAGYQFTAAGLRPLPGVHSPNEPWHPKLAQRFFAFLRGHPSIHLVVTTGFWQVQATGFSYRSKPRLYLDEDYDGSGLVYNKISFLHGLDRLLRLFPERTFALLEDVPTGSSMSPIFAARATHIAGARASEMELMGISRRAYEEQIATYRGILQAASQNSNAFVVPLIDVLCDDAFCPGTGAGHPYYRDGDHLTRLGAMRLVDTITAVLKRGLKLNAPTIAAATAR